MLLTSGVTSKAGNPGKVVSLESLNGDERTLKGKRQTRPREKDLLDWGEKRGVLRCILHRAGESI